MKYILLALLILLVPVNARANIICNDGTVSPSCSVCSRGCCSRHSGCTDEPNSSNSKSNNATSTKKVTIQKYSDYVKSINATNKQTEEEDSDLTGIYILIGIFCLPYVTEIATGIKDKIKNLTSK